MMAPVSARLTKLGEGRLLAPELEAKLHDTIADANSLLSKCTELATLVEMVSDDPRLARQLARRL